MNVEQYASTKKYFLMRGIYRRYWGLASILSYSFRCVALLYACAAAQLCVAQFVMKQIKTVSHFIKHFMIGFDHWFTHTLQVFIAFLDEPWRNLGIEKCSFVPIAG